MNCFTPYLNRIVVFCVLFITLFFELHAQTEAPSWVDFAEKKESGNLGEAILSDYSYAGYHFSEKQIPNASSWATFDVTSYGALPNDTVYDDDAIRAAIKAAIDSDAPAVIFFPAGKYLVADDANASQPFIINRSNIVLKGAGSGEGGTEIYADQCGNYPWRFHFVPDDASKDTPLTTTLFYKRINRGDFSVDVSSTKFLEEGQTVQLYHEGSANLEANAPGLSYKSDWRIGDIGIRPYEKHTIKSIVGNTVTFDSPIQYTMTSEVTDAELLYYNTLEEVGVEDILFTSAWKYSDSVYAHHASDFVDYAYRALAFENVKNAWVRNCEIRDWNESLMIEKCMGVTVKNLLISGKQGHTSYFARYSYGVLFEDCRDIVPVGFKHAGGQGHGPGMRWSTVNTVFKNCEMQQHQSIDCHGYHPYSNLLDNVYGGSFYNNGGAENAYPNSGPYMTFWNFIHASNYSTKEFDFWDIVNRKTHTYMNPLFVGFQAPGETITLKNTGLNELQGHKVYPTSLFDAQLQLRLYGGYMSASSSHPDFMPVNANDSSAMSHWTSQNAGGGEWLMLDLGRAESVYEVSIDEPTGTIGDWVLEGYLGNAWEAIASGTGIGADKVLSFDDFPTRKLRIKVISMKEGDEDTPVSIHQFKARGNEIELGIAGHSSANNILSIYPNPSSTIVNIDMQNEGLKHLSIYNLNGQLVWQQRTAQKSIQLHKGRDIKPGIYLVKVLGDNTETQKLIVN